MIVKKSEINKEVKSTNQDETRKRRMLTFNLKKKDGTSDVECVKGVFVKMGTHQRYDVGGSGCGATETEKIRPNYKANNRTARK